MLDESRSARDDWPLYTWTQVLQNGKLRQDALSITGSITALLVWMQTHGMISNKAQDLEGTLPHGSEPYLAWFSSNVALKACPVPRALIQQEARYHCESCSR